MLSTLSALLLISTLFMVIIGKTGTLIRLLGIQSCLIAGIAMVVGNLENVVHLYGAAILIILIKAIAVPSVLSKYLRNIDIRSVDAPLVSREMSLLIALGLIIMGYYVVPVQFSSHLQSSSLLSSAISVVLIGFFIVVSRRKGLSHLIGLLSLENGVSLAGMLLVRGIPIIVEAGIYIDVFISIGVILLFSQRIAAMGKG